MRAIQGPLTNWIALFETLRAARFGVQDAHGSCAECALVVMMWAYTLIVVVRARGAASDMRNAILGSSSACRRGGESTGFQGCWWDAKC